MATLTPLTLHQHNDETVAVTIDRVLATDDLTAVTGLEILFKDDRCDADDATTTVVLSTAVPAQAVILTQTAAQITVEVYVPASMLALAYDRWWRVDALTGVLRRTALYGPVLVVDV